MEAQDSLDELQTYAETLFPSHNGGGQVSTQLDHIGGMHAWVSKLLDPLHPSNFCNTCGKCYTEPRCLVGYLMIAGQVFIGAVMSNIKSRPSEKTFQKRHNDRLKLLSESRRE